MDLVVIWDVGSMVIVLHGCLIKCLYEWIHELKVVDGQFCMIIEMINSKLVYTITAKLFLLLYGQIFCGIATNITELKRKL